MSFSSPFNHLESNDEEHYHQTLLSGIAAAKSGNLEQARTLLQKASEMKPSDPQPWLWLSSTTEDLAERRHYLEYALAADPNNSAARRGLVFLSDKLDKSRVLDEGQSVEVKAADQPLETNSERVFECERCGGKLTYDVDRQLLVCEYCGYEHAPDLTSVADQAEQVLDFVLPTTRGHIWTEAQHRFVCQQCGAVAILASGEQAQTCAHCGSHQLLSSTDTAELIQPNVVAPAKITSPEAIKALRDWLGKGWFIPDDLKKLARPSALRPVYYPFWTFDGILQMNWVCEINQGTSKYPVWTTERGVEFEIFNDEVVPGFSKLNMGDIAQIEPFDLKAVAEYDPAFLADWNVLAYDYPLAEASLDAREKVTKRLKRDLSGKVFPGKDKRNLQSGETNWSGITYKLGLLPIYVGSYHYRGKDYQIYVNGQTGKVAGLKPVDRVKQILFWAMVAAGLIVLVLLGLLLGLNWGWIRF